MEKSHCIQYEIHWIKKIKSYEQKSINQISYKIPTKTRIYKKYKTTIIVYEYKHVTHFEFPHG